MRVSLGGAAQHSMRLLLLCTITTAIVGCRSTPVPRTAAPWFQAQRTLDLTGDGRADVVSIRAEGPSSESLLVTLTFLVNGEERWREPWYSDYMLIDPPHFPQGEVDRAAYVREGLKRALESVSVAAFDSAQYAMMADSIDSALVRQPPARQIMVSYGYETTLVLIWDPAKRTFRAVWGCC